MAVTNHFPVKYSDAQLNQSGETTYTDVYQVECDSPTTPRLDILGAPGFHRGDPHPDDATALCTNLAASVVSDDGCTWNVTITFGVWSADSTSENPLDEPVKISFDGQTYQKIVTKDCFGNAIVNSAGDPFDTPLQIDKTRHILILSRNVGWNALPSYLPYYVDAINSTPFFGWKPRCALVARQPISSVYSSICGYYWTIQTEIHFNPETWVEYLLDQGTRANIRNQFKQHITYQGVQVATPVPLDGHGNVKPNDAPFSYRAFRVRPELPFHIYSALYGV